MNNFGIKEYIRLIGSVSLSQSEKDRIAEELIQKMELKKEISKKHVAAASAVAVLAIGAFLAAREIKQDVNIM